MEHLDDKGSSVEKALRGAEIRIPVPWGHVAGKRWGNPEGYPVLGLHGWLDNAGSFDKLAPLLPSSFNFIVIDTPGHGFSSKLPPGMPYHFMDNLLTLRRVVEHLGWTKFSIIGHSLGAGMGALYASLYPYDVDNLVMIDLILPRTGHLESVTGETMNKFLSVEKSISQNPPMFSYMDALDIMKQGRSGAVSEDGVKILMVRGTRQVDEDEYVFTTDSRFPTAYLSKFGDNETLEILRGIRCRLLIIKAEDGPAFNRPDLEKRGLEIYQEKCAEFRKVVLGGNHFLHMNNPACVANEIRNFVIE